MPKPASSGEPDPHTRVAAVASGSGPRASARGEPSPGESDRDDSHLLCPFCDAKDVQLVSLFGSQLLMSQYQCRACRSYFEAVRTQLEDIGGRSQP